MDDHVQALFSPKNKNAAKKKSLEILHRVFVVVAVAGTGAVVFVFDVVLVVVVGVGHWRGAGEYMGMTIDDEEESKTFCFMQ